jgi:hypothetical protein
MNPNEKLLQALINDPSLLKLLEKMTKDAPKEKKAKKMKEMGNPSYVNHTTVKCKLCGSTHAKFLCMAYDSDEKLYRTSCHHQDNIWPTLPLFELVQRSDTCPSCAGNLLQLSKEELIQKLMYQASKPK